MAPARRSNRKRYGKKRNYRKRNYRSGRTYHGVKKFVSTFKFKDIVSAPNGTNAGGYALQNLAVSFSQCPLQSALSGLYRQYMITGVKWMYRPINVAPNQGDQENATQMLFVPDKSVIGNLSVTQATSQDNTKFLTTAKPYSHYIKMPRPTLFQLDATNNSQLVTQGARQANWIDVANNGLKHLNAQILVKDNATALPAGGVLQGELWCKMYIAVKEQTL